MNKTWTESDPSATSLANPPGAAKADPQLLRGVSITGELRGPLFEACVEQRFANSTDRFVEIAYTFPLPFGAVLLGVEAQMGERRFTGNVIEKHKAEATYESALADGDSAVLLERNADLSYCLSLGNLGPGEACVITLRYAQTLSYEQRGLRVLIPTVIAPRFGDMVVDGGLAPHQAPDHDFFAAYPFALSLRLHGDLAQARLASPSHPVSVARSADGLSVLVSLARKADLDRDFVLVVDQLAQDSRSVLACDTVLAQRQVALLSFCPVITRDAAAPVTVKILVDCSGSMAGDSIRCAGMALSEVIRGLMPDDRFSLSRFGSTVEHRSRSLWKTTTATRGAANHWVSELAADLGGTEMDEALASTFALGGAEPADLLMITDGEIAAIDETIRAARTAGQRLFIVGIGSSPAESHLRRLAQATGGSCDFVAPGEGVDAVVLRMFARLRSPRFTQLQLAWGEGASPLWVTPLPLCVFDGDTVNLFAAFERAPQRGVVRLQGRRVPGAAPEELACVALADSEPVVSGALARVAAASRISALEAEHPVPADQGRELALAYQLVSPWTSFVLVRQLAQADKPTEMPDTFKVRQMVPAGWGGAGSVLHAISASTCQSSPGPGPSKFSRSASRPMLTQMLSDFDDMSINDMSVDSSVSRPRRIREPVWPVDRTDSRYWSSANGQQGLTPLGLYMWLLNSPTGEWPTTFAALTRIGVPAQVTLWLQTVVAGQFGRKVKVRTVLGAFLRFFTLASTRMVFDPQWQADTPDWTWEAFDQARQLMSPGGVSFADHLAHAMADVTPASWPQDANSLMQAAQTPHWSDTGEW